MRVTLTGFGCGGWDGVTREGAAALEEADAIIGAARLLIQLPASCSRKRVSEVRPAEIFRILRKHAAPDSPESGDSAKNGGLNHGDLTESGGSNSNGWKSPCVIYSGDSGFYSGARLLIPLLEEAEIPYRVIPGVSSVQVFAARLGRSWENWTLCSAHGTVCDPVAAVLQGNPAFFLTGTDRHTSPAALCGVLDRAGLGDLPVTVGENLGGLGEQITHSTAAEAARKIFAPLSVLLAEAPKKAYPERTPGIPDGEFLRENTEKGEKRAIVPMTKQEVRAAVLSKLAIRPTDTVWDIGAGTGSVSVELARAAYRGRVFAVERNGAACDLIRRNREHFGAWNLTLISGEASEVLDALPAPDAVFIGGSGGKLESILDVILRKGRNIRICISAIALETLSAAVCALAARGLDAETVQISVSRTKAVKNLHLLMAQNPVFLITVKGSAL